MDGNRKFSKTHFQYKPYYYRTSCIKHEIQIKEKLIIFFSSRILTSSAHHSMKNEVQTVWNWSLLLTSYLIGIIFPQTSLKITAYNRPGLLITVWFTNCKTLSPRNLIKPLLHNLSISFCFAHLTPLFYLFFQRKYNYIVGSWLLQPWRKGKPKYKLFLFLTPSSVIFTQPEMSKLCRLFWQQSWWWWWWPATGHLSAIICATLCGRAATAAASAARHLREAQDPRLIL